jgi:benzodiazapine receptor
MKKHGIYGINTIWAVFYTLLAALTTTLVSVSIQHSFDPWYVALVKPLWFPAKWILGPTWFQAVFYSVICFAGWMIHLVQKSDVRNMALVLFFVQLFLNVLWADLFFYFRSPVLGLVDVLVFLVALLLTLRASWIVSRPATCLLIPSFIWSLYALALNIAIVYFK